MPLTPGTRLGVYEVISSLGAGGMGEVYRARDTRLNRDVALKVLPEAFSSDPDPAWSSDGTRVIFISSRDKVVAPYWQAANGTGAAERLTTYDYPLDQPAVSLDGKWIAMRARVPETGDDIVAVDLTQKGRVVPLVHTKFTERNPTISADGRWIAYESDESGITQVYVRPFPDVDTGRWQVSQLGGARPLWSRNGRELFFQARDTRLMSVPFKASPAFEFGNPTPVGNLSGYAIATGRNYDASADRSRFLVVATAERSVRPDINIVLNWAEELRKKVPTN